MECTAGDEQDMISFDHPVFRGNRGAFHQRQQIPLYALARYIRSGSFGAAGDFVDFVEEHDAVLFNILHRAKFQVLIIDEFGCLFIGNELHCLTDAQLTGLFSFPAQILEHTLNLRSKFFHSRRRKDFHVGMCR